MTGPFPARYVFLPSLVLAAVSPCRRLRGRRLPGRRRPQEGRRGDREGRGEERRQEGREERGQGSAKEPPFDKVVKGQDDPGTVQCPCQGGRGEVLPGDRSDQLEVPYLLNPTLASGIGQGFIYPNDMLPEYVVAFHRNGKTIPAHPQEHAVPRRRLFLHEASRGCGRPDAIVGQAKIESQPHPDRKSVLVDLGRSSSAISRDGIGAETDLRGPLPARQGRERRRLRPRVPRQPRLRDRPALQDT